MGHEEGNVCFCSSLASWSSVHPFLAGEMQHRLLEKTETRVSKQDACSETKIVGYLGQVMSRSSVSIFFPLPLPRLVKGKLLRRCSIDKSCTRGLRGWSDEMNLVLWKSSVHLGYSAPVDALYMRCIKKKGPEPVFSIRRKWQIEGTSRVKTH